MLAHGKRLVHPKTATCHGLLRRHVLPGRFVNRLPVAMNHLKQVYLRDIHHFEHEGLRIVRERGDHAIAVRGRVRGALTSQGGMRMARSTDTTRPMLCPQLHRDETERAGVCPGALCACPSCLGLHVLKNQYDPSHHVIHKSTSNAKSAIQFRCLCRHLRSIASKRMRLGASSQLFLWSLIL